DAVGQQELGIELATRQAEGLLRDGAPGIHLYTLNRAEPTLRIFGNLGLTAAPGREHKAGPGREVAPAGRASRKSAACGTAFCTRCARPCGTTCTSVERR